MVDIWTDIYSENMIYALLKCHTAIWFSKIDIADPVTLKPSISNDRPSYIETLDIERQTQSQWNTRYRTTAPVTVKPSISNDIPSYSETLDIERQTQLQWNPRYRTTCRSSKSGLVQCPLHFSFSSETNKWNLDGVPSGIYSQYHVKAIIDTCSLFYKTHQRASSWNGIFYSDEIFKNKSKFFITNQTRHGFNF